MKNITLGFLFICSLLSQAQELNYGITLGGNLYEIYSDGGISNESGNSKIGLLIGGFLDYGFSDKIGAKVLIAYNKKTMGGNIPTEYNFLDISPNFKYNFGSDYGKGFYLLIGPRFSFLLNAKIEGQDMTDGFENSNVGLQLGLGTNVFKFLELELRFDYGFTAVYEITNQKRKMFGGILALNLNLEKLLLN